MEFHFLLSFFYLKRGIIFAQDLTYSRPLFLVTSSFKPLKNILNTGLMIPRKSFTSICIYNCGVCIVILKIMTANIANLFQKLINYF